MKSQKPKTSSQEAEETRKQTEKFLSLCEEPKTMAAKLLAEFDTGRVSVEKAAERNRELFQRLKDIEKTFVNFSARRIREVSSLARPDKSF